MLFSSKWSIYNILQQQKQQQYDTDGKFYLKKCDHHNFLRTQEIHYIIKIAKTKNGQPKLCPVQMKPFSGLLHY